MKLLLVGPSRYDDEGKVLKKKKSLIPRLGLLHLAGLTPEDVDVSIIDEIVDDIDFSGNYDIVGITAFTSQVERAYTIADEFRQRGKAVIMGGIHISSLPDEAQAHADSVIIGEADYIWEQIIADFKSGELKPRYKCEKFHDLKGLPVPRYDLVDKKKYLASTMPVQASRGCPHNCDFCTVTKFFGGSYRLRPVDEVIRDIKATGSKRIFFIDDNIIANRAYSRELFEKLIPLNLVWMGQCTINLGLFPDLCALMAKSGCFWLCIGVESVNQRSLNSVDKNHNKVSEYHKLLKTIRASGLTFILSMIVGFDEDDETIFGDTVSFVNEVKPIVASMNVPIPYPGTKLTARLESEGRILHKNWSKYRSKNVVFKPKLLGAEQLEEMAIAAHKEVYSFKSILLRGFAQPVKLIFRALIVNFVARLNAAKGENWNSG